MLGMRCYRGLLVCQRAGVCGAMVSVSLGVITPGGPASSPLLWHWASTLFSFSHSDRCTVKPHLGLPGPWPTCRGPALPPSTPVPHPHPPTHPGCLERMSMRTGLPGPVCKRVCMRDSWGYWGWRWVGTMGDHTLCLQTTHGAGAGPSP